MKKRCNKRIISFCVVKLAISFQHERLFLNSSAPQKCFSLLYIQYSNPCDCLIQTAKNMG